MARLTLTERAARAARIARAIDEAGRDLGPAPAPISEAYAEYLKHWPKFDPRD